MKNRFLSKYLSTLAFLSGAALVILSVVPQAWGAKPQNQGGYQTLCEGSASATVNGKNFSFSRKTRLGIEEGKVALLNDDASNLGIGKYPRIKAPAAGYLLNSIVVEVQSDTNCFINNVTYNFTGPGDPISVDTDDNDGDQYKQADIRPTQEEIFNGLKDVLGYSSLVFSTDEGNALAESICSYIADQTSDGQTPAENDAQIILSLAGSIDGEMWRCLASSSIVQVVNSDQTPSSCSVDDRTSTTAFTLLANAPELHLSVATSGDGSFTITNTDNNTSANVVLSSDGTCVVDGENFQF